MFGRINEKKHNKNLHSRISGIGEHEAGVHDARQQPECARGGRAAQTSNFGGRLDTWPGLNVHEVAVLLRLLTLEEG